MKPNCQDCHLENVCPDCPFIENDWSNWKKRLDKQKEEAARTEIETAMPFSGGSMDLPN